jgi:hypothetical protein
MIAAAAAALLAHGSAGAQGGGNPVTPQIIAYLQSEVHGRALAGAAQQQLARIPGACPNGRYERIPSISFFAPAQFDAQGNPTHGAWKESFDYVGCDSRRRFNLITVVLPGKGAQVAPLLPGTTIADPRLQKDSILFAFTGTAALTHDCKEKLVVDTHFDAWTGDVVKDAASPHARPWQETWTVWACGQAIDVPMHFTPDRTGTGIRSAPSEAKPHT